MNSSARGDIILLGSGPLALIHCVPLCERIDIIISQVQVTVLVIEGVIYCQKLFSFKIQIEAFLHFYNDQSPTC